MLNRTPRLILFLRKHHGGLNHFLQPIPQITQLRMSSSRPSSTSPPKNPLILILGATGTGKSALALHLAQHLRTEIVNSDAMQLYTGLPIITNKLSEVEQEGVPHHLLGHIGLEEQPWTVNKFVREADRVIEEISVKGGRLPIVVGGTGYYAHGLLLRGSTLSGGEDGDGGEDKDEEHEKPEADVEDVRKVYPILEASTEEIYAELAEVDPDMARRWHPKDRRKIQRSLEIWLKTGRKASEVYEEQKKQKEKAEDKDSADDVHTVNGNKSTAELKMRYSTLIFWLDAEDAVLKERLNKRVDSMVKNGLLEEAMQMARFEDNATQKGIMLDKSKGIWVSIGYKEMEPWVQAQRESKPRDEKNLDVLRDSCIKAVKAGTRRYAKRQNRYIRIRLANALAEANATNNLFLLDCTNLTTWKEDVAEPAVRIVDAFLKGENLPEPRSLSELARKTLQNTAGSEEDGTEGTNRVARRCETCDKVLMTEKEWTKHVSSRSHKRILDGIRKHRVNEERRQMREEVSLASPDPG